MTEQVRPEKGKARPPQGYISNPMKTRQGEKIGGGWFVFRRGDRTGRVRVSQWPYEHPTRESAVAEASRLAMEAPGYRYEVLRVDTSFAMAATTSESEAA